MHLIIQIPCLNEQDSIGSVIECIPREIPGINKVSVLVVDDGSDDKTAQAAKKAGADYIVVHRKNRGLARAFETGLRNSLELGADIIVNTDADGQYPSKFIPDLVKPIVDGVADISIGDRRIHSREIFSPIKRVFQILGSWLVSRVSGIQVNDAVCGFRAYSRYSARSTNVLSDFSYTTETIIQAGISKMRVVNVPINSVVDTRASRLAKSMADFVIRQAVTIVRALFMYQPLKLFLSLALFFFTVGMIPFLRFIYFYLSGAGDGHIQSLLTGLVLLVGSFILAAVGILADLVAFNRKLLERILFKLG